MGAHAGGLALAFALEAQHGAEHRSHQQAQEDAGDFSFVGDIGEFCLDGLPDGVH
ncbi:hypothetical protein D3C76_1743120 [compost metagenome]